MSNVSSGPSRSLDLDGHPLTSRRVRACSKAGSGKFFLARASSSPGGLDIAQFLSSRYQQDPENLPSCQSSAIRLENRQTGDFTAGPVRPKLFALGDGSVSVEPRVRKSLTRGTPIRSQSVCFGSIAEAAEGILVGSFIEASEQLRGKFAQQIIRSIEKKDERKKEKDRQKEKQKNLTSVTGQVNAD